MEQEFVDFLVIGSGPAGQKGAVQASKFGLKTVVIEGYETGGSSLWTGTIPSKALREAILDLTNFRRKSFYAKEALLPKMSEISISDLNFRVNWVKEHLKETISRQLKKNQIEIVRGFAQFQDPHIVNVYQNETLIRKFYAEKILLTPGSTPRCPPGIRFDGEYIYNSSQLVSINKIPSSLIVLGAGVIGSEYASMFGLLGTKVTLIDKRPRLLSFLDREIGSHLQIALEENNITFLGSKDYEKVEVINKEVVVTFKGGGEVRAESALIASGRIANVNHLNIQAAGLDLSEDGYIAVDKHYRTAQEHIYAAGDVIGGPCLSSTSYVQGRLAAMNACGHEIDRFTQVHPYGIYTIPEISSIGKTEEMLKMEGIDYAVGRAYFYEVSRSVITGSESGLCKLLFDPKNLTLLGAHIIGRGASEVIHIAQLAISFNAKIDYFVDQTFNFPTFAEMYRIAALNGINKLNMRRLGNGHLQHF